MTHDFSRYVAAPGAAVGPVADPIPSPAAEVSPVAPVPVAAPAPDVYFVEGDRPRRLAVPLSWPIVYDGKRLDAVVVRRLQVHEVRAYVAAVQAGGEASLPMYELPDGAPLPKAVLDRLDQDDFDAIDAKAFDFLPLALRGDPT